jgi:hypothetical protein
MGIFLLVPFLWKSKADSVSYSGCEKNKGYMTYSQLRDLQWRSSGDLERGLKTKLCGIVKYPKKGLKFKPGTATAEKAEGAFISRLFIKKFDKEEPLGKGDVKLNFNKQQFPEDGAAVMVEGEASVGKFKDIIVDVQSWKKLKAVE